MGLGVTCVDVCGVGCTRGCGYVIGCIAGFVAICADGPMYGPGTLMITGAAAGAGAGAASSFCPPPRTLEMSLEIPENTIPKDFACSGVMKRASIITRMMSATAEPATMMTIRSVWSIPPSPSPPPPSGGGAFVLGGGGAFVTGGGAFVTGGGGGGGALKH